MTGSRAVAGPTETTGDPAAPVLEIVEFAPHLARAFRDLNVEWLERYFRVEPIDERILGNPQEEIIDHGGHVLFARRGGDVVGTVALKNHGQGIYELTKMAVTAGCQGLGVGRRLLAAAVDRFDALGGKQLFLDSHSSLAPALHLYETAGFRHVRRTSPSEYARADVHMVWEPPADSPGDPS